MLTSRRIALVVGGIATLAVCAGVLGALWLSSDSRADNQARESAWRLWKAKQPDTYSFDYSHCGGMCAGCRLRITVVKGKVTDAVGREGQCSDYHLKSAPTIDSIFAMAERERTAPMTDSMEVHYDPTWGFPASIQVRCPPHTSDCGSSYRVSGFRPSR